jgi:hypothetical protein
MKPPATLASVKPGWYPLALIPTIGLVGLPLLGWLPILVLPFGLFLLFFWIFSFGFAVYAKTRSPKEPRP